MQNTPETEDSGQRQERPRKKNAEMKNKEIKSICGMIKTLYASLQQTKNVQRDFPSGPVAKRSSLVAQW